MPRSVVCNCCGTDDATEVFPPGNMQLSRIVRCNRCGLMYANPRVQEPDHVVVRAYDPTLHPVHRCPPRYEKEKLQVRDFAQTRALLNRLHPQRGKLLEIGSGLGFLLKEFQNDGWEVMGLEPDLIYCRHACEELGVQCVQSTLEEMDFPDESLDVVVMNHVIEHLDDPLATLKNVHRILKPNGRFTLETPCFDTLILKLLGRRERNINSAGHLYFFTTRTLRNLYEAAGFELIQFNYVGRSLTLDKLVWTLGVISKSDRLQRWVAVPSRKLGLHRLSIYLNLRDLQRVCIQKKGDAGVVDAEPHTSSGPG